GYREPAARRGTTPGLARSRRNHVNGKAAMGILDDKVAIVTGSARGIGRATAELLASHGAKVLINDLDADAAEQAASEIVGDTLVFGGDLTTSGVCDQLVDRVIEAWGTVDVLVNN